MKPNITIHAIALNLPQYILDGIDKSHRRLDDNAVGQDDLVAFDDPRESCNRLDYNPAHLRMTMHFGGQKYLGLVRPVFPPSRDDPNVPDVPVSWLEVNNVNFRVSSARFKAPGPYLEHVVDLSVDVDPAGGENVLLRVFRDQFCKLIDSLSMSKAGKRAAVKEIRSQAKLGYAISVFEHDDAVGYGGNETRVNYNPKKRPGLSCGRTDPVPESGKLTLQQYVQKLAVFGDISAGRNLFHVVAQLFWHEVSMRLRGQFFADNVTLHDFLIKPLRETTPTCFTIGPIDDNGSRVLFSNTNVVLFVNAAEKVYVSNWNDLRSWETVNAYGDNRSGPEHGLYNGSAQKAEWAWVKILHDIFEFYETIKNATGDDDPSTEPAGTRAAGSAGRGRKIAVSKAAGKELDYLKPALETFRALKIGSPDVPTAAVRVGMDIDHLVPIFSRFQNSEYFFSSSLGLKDHNAILSLFLDAGDGRFSSHKLMAPLIWKPEWESWAVNGPEFSQIVEENEVVGPNVSEAQANDLRAQLYRACFLDVKAEDVDVRGADAAVHSIKVRWLIRIVAGP